jgi:hypothetical protein
MNYDVAKSHRPIGLINTIPKGLSTLVCKHVSYLMEKHNLLPAAQFGGRPGRNTTDAMLLVVDHIKAHGELARSQWLFSLMSREPFLIPSKISCFTT